MSLEFCVKVHKIGGEYSFLPPSSLRDACESLWSRSKEKHGGFLSVKISTPRKPRTTGRGSQNNACFGYATQLANYTGDDVHRILYIAKVRAFRRGYPAKKDEDGNIIMGVDGAPVPASQADISTVEAGHLIDELQQIAAEMDFILEES